MTKNTCLNQTRSFNELVFSDKYVTKKSTYVEKFFDEIIWLVKAPDKIKKYLPEIIDYSLKIDNLFIKMERISSGSFHDFIIKNKKTNLVTSKSLYEDLFLNFRQVVPNEFNKTTWTKRFLEMYILKTIKRLEIMKNDRGFSGFFESDVVSINGKKYCSPKKILFLLNEFIVSKNVNKNKLLKSLITPLRKNICLLHGDLCFSNVFINEKSKTLKCVDPRGSFDDDKVFGDCLYDFAKVYQCVYGLYDFIIEDQFEYTHKNKGFTYKIYENNSIIECQKIYKTFFPKNLLGKIKLIESLLFLSMTPLHSDSYDRQVVMMLQGITKFCKAYKC